ncbi:MAG TPA: hypothetical protein VGG20_19580 [Thermoanaerobaculia bacterium]|jgi:hypothetical protein
MYPETMSKAEKSDAVIRESRERFLELADRLAHAGSPEEQSRLKEELARMTFGE